MIGTKLTESGNYNITITAVDKAGNIAETSKQATILDVTPPVATISLAGTEGETEGTYKGDVVVTASATDSESGMESLSVSIIKDGSEFYTNTIENTEDETIMDTISLTDPGAYTITITATDKAGNITETSKEITVELAIAGFMISTPHTLQNNGNSITVSNNVQDSFISAYEFQVNAYIIAVDENNNKINVPDGTKIQLNDLSLSYKLNATSLRYYNYQNRKFLILYME